jgi:hypothetical protein
MQNHESQSSTKSLMKLIREYEKHISDETIEKTLWVALKFGLPFLIVFALFFIKGIFLNYVYEHEDAHKFNHVAIHELSRLTNHALIISIIGISEVFGEILLRRDNMEKWDVSKIGNFVLNLFLIILTMIFLISSEVAVENFEDEHGHLPILAFYSLQIVMVLAIFLKIFIYDLGFNEIKTLNEDIKRLIQSNRI